MPTMGGHRKTKTVCRMSVVGAISSSSSDARLRTWDESGELQPAPSALSHVRTLVNDRVPV
jgi:hypothetical protein